MLLFLYEMERQTKTFYILCSSGNDKPIDVYDSEEKLVESILVRGISNFTYVQFEVPITMDKQNFLEKCKQAWKRAEKQKQDFSIATK